MINFVVDKEKCVHCGLCSADCPVLIIDGKTEFPTIKEGKEKNCLKCQHCLAICPEGAISIWGKKPEDSIPACSALPETADLENLMKLRRSIRKFKKEEINQDEILQMVKTASHAPTGKNENAVRFNVIDNKEQMDKVRELAYNFIKEAKENKTLPESKLYLDNFRQVWDAKGVDVIFRDAPHMLITSVPKRGTMPQTDGIIALTYFDLLANSKGIGTLWNGFAKYVFEEFTSEKKQEIGIPENHEINMVLVFGKSGRKFQRSIQNDEADIFRLGRA